MPDYIRRTQVAAPVQDLFDYLAEVRNLPDYFPGMIRAEPTDGEAVDTAAMVHGRREDGEAWFHADHQNQTLRWGSEGENDYHGELSVARDPAGATVTVSLHTERVDSEEIDQGLEQTLSNIKRIVEDEAAPPPTA